VFGQLQTSLNVIWNVMAKPTRPGASIWAWVRKRVLSLGMLLALGFLLLVSLFFSAVAAVVLPRTGWIWMAANTFVSIGVAWMLFALIFKFLPDVKIAWRHVWTGSLITAILFGLGKYAIAKYLGYSSVKTSYGAAGSLVVFLLWVYYSSLILFFGAELTQARAGKYVPPEEHAVKVKEVEKKPA
jgi:membrane protein